MDGGVAGDEQKRINLEHWKMSRPTGIAENIVLRIVAGVDNQGHFCVRKEKKSKSYSKQWTIDGDKVKIVRKSIFISFFL